jgi:hypothetical protein
VVDLSREWGASSICPQCPQSLAVVWGRFLGTCKPNASKALRLIASCVPSVPIKNNALAVPSGPVADAAGPSEWI